MATGRRATGRRLPGGKADRGRRDGVESAKSAIFIVPFLCARGLIGTSRRLFQSCESRCLDSRRWQATLKILRDDCSPGQQEAWGRGHDSQASQQPPRSGEERDGPVRRKQLDRVRTR
ncbi:hypothetical protein CC78DRAFT_534910 [Lojkania enalia]|uniref:Uncharacterized protein n=1 Tax=Lojkania enalia TaxID=147567 RepID=A0A9P4K5C0_9PLEO|nr:hypothetical protein CC78DRAFT_534910 [Didymosphaeria enalia]